MKLNNCLRCCAHRDNKDFERKCLRHIFSISESTKKKYDWAIDYIKKENAEGRHMVASLGSAGFTFVEDIKTLGNYAYAIGDKEFYNQLNAL